MKESLLQYCWKHRILPYGQMQTTDGLAVEVLDPGIQNADAGPDFFNAKLKIGGEYWVGNIEVHIASQDWYRHGHDHDAAYDNVILHVVSLADNSDVRTSAGRMLPQLVVPVPEHIQQNHDKLLSIDSYPPCYKIIEQIKSLTVHSWMAALQTERLMQKTSAIESYLESAGGDWEHAYFVSLARSFGFGSNGDALEMWARHLPLNSVAHHRDDLFQVEAMFFGLAGLLNITTVRERMKLETAADDYFQRLGTEYDYLKHKFRLDDAVTTGYPWKFMRMRPQNYPHIRIAQLARLFHEGRTSLQHIIEKHSLADIQKNFRCGVSSYWEEHYTFGHESKRNTKLLSATSINALTINCVIPMIFAYGRHMGNESLCEYAFELLDELKPEDNTITRMWQDVGLHVRSAGDSQALIQLKKNYCDRKDCLRCRFGYEYLRQPE